MEYVTCILSEIFSAPSPFLRITPLSSPASELMFLIKREILFISAFICSMVSLSMPETSCILLNTSTISFFIKLIISSKQLFIFLILEFISVQTSSMAFAAFDEFTARLLISDERTANPFPAAPAFEDSIDAFTASS